MRREPKFNSINVVPFIDVMLVLLVIVLLTASFVQTGLIKTKLPKGQSKATLNKKNLKITIKSNGKILFNNNPIETNSIEENLKKYKKDTIIYIYASRDLKFNSFTNLLNILKIEGYTNIGIVTKKWDISKPYL